MLVFFVSKVLTCLARHKKDFKCFKMHVCEFAVFVLFVVAKKRQKRDEKRKKFIRLFMHKFSSKRIFFEKCIFASAEAH